MEAVFVNQILDDRAKHGYSEKTKKEWSMSRVGLSNGESAFIFNPIEVGDIVEEQINGEYKNWAKKKTDPKHEEIMKALREIYKAITGGYPEKEEPKVIAEQIPEQLPETPVKKPDPVVDVPDDDINVNDIPF